jgi:hypothetical protein
VIPLAQQERGLIPLLLDPDAFEELVGGQRLQPTLTGRHTGQLVVSSGVACIAGATVLGPVTVQPGATLIATGSSFSGSVTATGAAGVFVTASAVHGPLRISGTTQAVFIAAATVNGELQLTGNTPASGAAVVSGNTVNGPLRCSGNSPDPVNLEIANTVNGPRSGQCVPL